MMNSVLSSKRTWLACGLVAVGAAIVAALSHPAGSARRAGHEGEPDADPVGGHEGGPDADPVGDHEGESDAAPVGVPPPDSERTIECRSANGKYEVDLRFASPNSTLPSRAHVVIDGQPPEGPPVPDWPPPGELTCSTESDSASIARCRVEGTADYGYIAKVSTEHGRHRVELAKNGLSSTRLATFGCRE